MTIWSYGITMIDVVLLPVDEWPGPAGLIICETGEFSPGGVGLNTAVAIGRLGGAVGLMGAVGDDTVGSAVIDELRTRGVRVDAILHVGGVTTGFCVVGVAASGERSLAAHLGANLALAADRVDWDLTRPGDHLHVGGIFGLPQLRDEGLLAVLEGAREHGMTTSAETTWDPSGRWLEGIAEHLRLVDVFLTNEAEAKGMTHQGDPHESAASIAAHGPSVVIVKGGVEGCYVHVGGETTHIPAFRVPVADCTGAGDCFCGGFLYARAGGRSLEDSARFANAVGGLTCTRLGATAGVPDALAVEAFMSDTETYR